MAKLAVLFAFVFVTLFICETMAKCTPPSCPDGQEYTTCGSACPKTCSQPSDRVCTMQCVSGCFCKAPKVLDEASGTCVEEDDCPAEPCLNENEVYDGCSGGCEPSCFDPEPICNKICMGGCICAPGLLRNDSGDCVSVDKCPNNGTDVTLLAKYLNAINNILRL